MYVGLKQPRGNGERYVTPARAAAKETRFSHDIMNYQNLVSVLSSTPQPSTSADNTDLGFDNS